MRCPVCRGTGSPPTNRAGVCGYCRGTGLWDNRPYIAAGPGFLVLDGIDGRMELGSEIARTIGRFGRLARRLED